MTARCSCHKQRFRSERSALAIARRAAVQVGWLPDIWPCPASPFWHIGAPRAVRQPASGGVAAELSG